MQNVNLEIDGRHRANGRNRIRFLEKRLQQHPALNAWMTQSRREADI